MQVKVIIGTVAFMMAMMVFGYATLREPARLERFTAARSGRQIEVGAELFANNCSTCHGVSGKAEECYDSAGNQIGCKGLPLNYAPLLCGDDRSLRMETMNWQGTKGDFILTTVAAGRVGTVMPTWAEQFGGPMRPDQVENVAMFVLNWQSEELCSTPIVVYEWPETEADFVAEYPEGDAARGGELFVTYGCIGCHGDPDADSSAALVGPWLGEIAEVGGTRVDGLSAEEYVYESILLPSAFISPECPTGPCAGPPSAMPDNFPLRMGENPQDMADVLTYLLGE